MALYSEVKQWLHQTGVAQQLDDSLNKLFSEHSPYCNPFREVSTYHHQQKFLQKNFSLTVSGNKSTVYCLFITVNVILYRNHTAFHLERIRNGRMWTKKKIHPKTR